MIVCVLLIIAGAIYMDGVKAIPYCLMFLALYLQISSVGEFTKRVIEVTTAHLKDLLEATKEKMNKYENN